MINQERFLKQIEWAASRYRINDTVRKSRQEALSNLIEPGSWRTVEEPSRTVHRLRTLGHLGLATRLVADDRPTDSVESANFLERIIGGTDFLGAAFLPIGAAVRRSVGRVIEHSSGFGFGTGFMVSPTLLMTNNHVLPSAADAQKSAIEFDYLDDPTDSSSATSVHTLDPMRFFVTDEELDFTLVAVTLASTTGTELSRGWSPLIAQSGKALISERVNIIQHPSGKPQQLALRDNKIVDLVGDFLHYEADTQPGSSGSPVYNDQWELAALHHAGVPKRDDQGRILLIDNSVWDGSPAGVSDIAWLANEGVRISSISSHLMTIVTPSLSPTQQSLLGESFQAPPPMANREIVTADRPYDSRNTVSMNENGEAVWEIPLRVSVNLPIDAQRLRPKISPTQSVQTVPQPVDRHSIDANAEERLARFRDRPYFDEEADRQAFNEYFEGFPITVSDEERFDLLHKLVTDTHTTKLSYRSARLDYLYAWVDLHECNGDGPKHLESIYSGRQFSPLAVITEEILSEQRRLTELAEFRHANTLPTAESLNSQLELLEARYPFNCEHVVPQSWFSKAEPMKSDLHHLFTCEWDCNSFRSNFPYFDFTSFSEGIRDKCGRREDEGFEPERGKGCVARATLYFLVRYPGLIGDGQREMKRKGIQTLLDWHYGDLPGIYEFHRNAATYEIQGNRNPFIDWPELVEVTDFTRGFRS